MKNKERSRKSLHDNWGYWLFWVWLHTNSWWFLIWPSVWRDWPTEQSCGMLVTYLGWMNSQKHTMWAYCSVSESFCRDFDGGLTLSTVLDAICLDHIINPTKHLKRIRRKWRVQLNKIHVPRVSWFSNFEGKTSIHSNLCVVPLFTLSYSKVDSLTRCSFPLCTCCCPPSLLHCLGLLGVVR